MIDLGHWLTRDQAAARLQVSGKTVDRMADRQQLERRMRARPRRKPEPVFDPQAVDAIAGARSPAIVALSRERTTPAPAATPPAQATGIDVAAIARAIAQALAPPRTSPAWLTLPEAAQHTGLSQSLLRRLAKAGHIRAIRDGSTKLLRDDLDNVDAIATVSLPAFTKRQKDNADTIPTASKLRARVAGG